MFFSDYPRGHVNSFFLWWFPATNTLPVALALPVPFPFARGGGPVSLLCLPPRPLPRRVPALFAAIPLTGLSGMKALLASFQQTTPHPRPACETLTRRQASVCNQLIYSL